MSSSLTDLDIKQILISVISAVAELKISLDALQLRVATLENHDKILKYDNRVARLKIPTNKPMDGNPNV